MDVHLKTFAVITRGPLLKGRNLARRLPPFSQQHRSGATYRVRPPLEDVFPSLGPFGISSWRGGRGVGDAKEVS